MSQRGFRLVIVNDIILAIPLIEFLDLRGDIHGEVRMVMLVMMMMMLEMMLEVLIMRGDQTKGKRFCRGSGGGAINDSRLRMRMRIQHLAVKISGRGRTVRGAFAIPRTRRREVIGTDAGAVGGERFIGEIRLGRGGVAPVVMFGRVGGIVRRGENERAVLHGYGGAHGAGVEREGKKKRKEEEKRGRKVQEISPNSPHVRNPYTRISKLSSAPAQLRYERRQGILLSTYTVPVRPQTF